MNTKNDHIYFEDWCILSQMRLVLYRLKLDRMAGISYHETLLKLQLMQYEVQYDLLHR